jgi:hypothetical protein
MGNGEWVAHQGCCCLACLLTFILLGFDSSLRKGRIFGAKIECMEEGGRRRWMRFVFTVLMNKPR